MLSAWILVQVCSSTIENFGLLGVRMSEQIYCVAFSVIGNSKQLSAYFNYAVSHLLFTCAVFMNWAVTVI